MNNSLKDIQDIIDVQCYDGNWNYDPYMLGLTNGLILAKAIIEKIDPQYLEAPEKWVCDNQKKPYTILSDKVNSWSDYTKLEKKK